jgi:hypothetical protein
MPEDMIKRLDSLFYGIYRETSQDAWLKFENLKIKNLRKSKSSKYADEYA